MVSQSTQADAARFLFSTNFEDAGEAAHAQAKAAPTFTAEELARAEEVGRAAGHEAGLAEARASQEETVALALAQLEQQLASAEAGLVEHQATLQRRAIEIALTALRKLFPELARRNGLDECMALIGKCLERLRNEPRLVIRVAEDALDPLKAQVDALIQRCGYESRVIFLADDSLGPGDLRVEWADGGAEQDNQRLWQEIDEILIGAGMACGAETAAAGAPRAASDSAVGEPTAEPQQTESRVPPASDAPTQEHGNE